MKVVIDIPSNARVMTYQVVFFDNTSEELRIISCVLDTNDIDRLVAQKPKEEHHE